MQYLCQKNLTNEINGLRREMPGKGYRYVKFTDKRDMACRAKAYPL